MAQGKLGYLYLVGLGVEKDLSKAYAWLKLAAINENEQAAIEFKRLEPILTLADKKAGEILLKKLKMIKPAND